MNEQAVVKMQEEINRYVTLMSRDWIIRWVHTYNQVVACLTSD